MKTCKYIAILLPLMASMAFDAAALPKTKATQVAVDPSGISSSTNTDVQGVLEDMDSSFSRQATTNQAGRVQLATADEVLTGTNNQVAITPESLAMSYADPSLGSLTSGWSKLPSGLILQWGKITRSGAATELIFPSLFSSNSTPVVTANFDTQFNDNYGNATFVTSVTVTGCVFRVGNSTSPSGVISWMAIGY